MAKTKGAPLLRKEIKARGITAAQAAADLKVNKSTMSMWIQGKYLPSADKRDLIEVWSEGRVPRASWRDAKAQSALTAAGPTHGDPSP